MSWQELNLGILDILDWLFIHMHLMDHITVEKTVITIRYVLKEVTAIRACAPLHGSNIVLRTLVCQSDNKLMTTSLKNMVLIYLLVQTACI